MATCTNLLDHVFRSRVKRTKQALVIDNFICCFLPLNPQHTQDVFESLIFKIPRTYGASHYRIFYCHLTFHGMNSGYSMHCVVPILLFLTQVLLQKFCRCAGHWQAQTPTPAYQPGTWRGSHPRALLCPPILVTAALKHTSNNARTDTDSRAV